jgi:hypothetical protein
METGKQFQDFENLRFRDLGIKRRQMRSDNKEIAKSLNQKSYYQ